jgi:hypothetical protein
MGQVDVQALAQAMQSGALGGSFVKTSYDQFPGNDAGPTDFTSDCLDDATAQQIAGLLPGSSVVKLPVEAIQATNGPVPTCNWIQTPDGVIRAADVLAIGKEGCSISGLSPLCCLQQLLANNIPGGQMDSSCTYAPGTSNPLVTGGGGAFVPPTTSGPSSPIAVQNPIAPVMTPITSIPSPILPTTQVSLPTLTTSAPPSSSQVVTGTPGSSIGTPVTATPASGDVVIGGFDLSQIPWWGWAIAGGAALLLLKGK